jgi:hypothetical protein
MTTPSNNPDDFAPIADDRDVQAALQPKKTMNMPAATAVLVAIVVLAIGLAGGAGLHAAFAGGSTPQAGAGGAGRGMGGYGQGGYGQGRPGGGAGGPGGGGTVGTIVSADSSQLVVKTQTGNVTVKLTGSTAIEITAKGAVSDLKTGEQVVVSGTSANGTMTADTVRQGGAPGGGGFNRGGATPSK